MYLGKTPQTIGESRPSTRLQSFRRTDSDHAEGAASVIFADGLANERPAFFQICPPDCHELTRARGERGEFATHGVDRSQASTHFGCQAPNLSRESKFVKPVPGTAKFVVFLVKNKDAPILIPVSE
jgi:hypothetical protein